ncbi:hypothetical protein VTI74DRAFT_10227 [Chaetomium olivicolor]
MRYTASALAAVFVGFGTALQAQVEDRRTYIPCSGVFPPAKCCATDVLGISDLDCGDRDVPTSANNFSAVCSAIGQHARCCMLPIPGEDIICTTPTGVNE